MSDLWSRSDATLPPFDERLKQLLDNAAAGIRASRTEIERAVTYLETARRLLAGGPTTVQPLTYALPSHLSSASSRWFVSSRSHRRASAAIPSRRHRSRWPPAPGAHLPCTRTGCSGTMQYGHPVGYAQSVATTDAERGWVCSDRARHVRLPHAPLAPVPIAGLVARARWEDDGGSRK
jgi:hypothetical protein